MPADCTVYNATTINWTNQEVGDLIKGPVIKEMYFKGLRTGTLQGPIS